MDARMVRAGWLVSGRQSSTNHHMFVYDEGRSNVCAEHAAAVRTAVRFAVRPAGRRARVQNAWYSNQSYLQTVYGIVVAAGV